METFMVGQTVSIPLLKDHGKGIIYAIAPANKSGYTHYVRFADRIGKRIFPSDLLKLETVPVKTSKRWVDINEEESVEEIYIEDSPSGKIYGNDKQMVIGIAELLAMNLFKIFTDLFNGQPQQMFLYPTWLPRLFMILVNSQGIEMRIGFVRVHLPMGNF